MVASPVKSLNGVIENALERAGLTRGATVVVAVSGGPDSLTLLHCLDSAARDGGIRLHGAHLDHGLRGEASTADARYVSEVFRSLGIEATLDRADVASFRKEHKLSVEDAARRVRYDFLGRVAAEHEADAIALGHTADDQAETVLMHVLRGSGLTGLVGMHESARRKIAGGDFLLLRPLLTVSRQDTEAYCQALGLEPRRDETNLLPELTRNRLRSELLPLLEQYNPAVKEALVRLSRSAALDAEYFAAEVSRALPEAGALDEDGGTFSIRRDSFLKLPHALQGHLLRRAVLDVKGDMEDLEQVHVDEMVRLIGGPAGRSLDLPSGLLFTVGYEVATIGGSEVQQCPLPLLDMEHDLSVPGETQVGEWLVRASLVDNAPGHEQKPAQPGSGTFYTTTLNAGAVGTALSVRTRRPGDRFQPLGMSQTKKLQDFMVDSKVPRSWRDRVPLVVCPSGIAWVVGWRPADWAKVGDGDAPALVLSFRHED